MPELLILKGDLLVALSSSNAAEAESLYQDAVNNARGGCSNAGTTSRHNIEPPMEESRQDEEARELLGAAYSKITEGFTTADLIEARALCHTVVMRPSPDEIGVGATED